MTGWTYACLAGGFVLLVAGAEALVRGASRLAAAAGISPLVIGLTVVAFGTSSPELAVSVKSAWSGEAELAVGNIVGSNISNVLLILGISAMVAPLVVHQRLVRIDVPLMVCASLLMWGMALDGGISRTEGAMLLAALVANTALTIRQSRRESRGVAAEYKAEFGAKGRETAGRFAAHAGLAAAGLALLTLGSDWLVRGAVALAKSFGVDELLIGLTVIAVGTSLPELATSVMASYRGERDIAVGNVVGSNLFNILGVLGASALIAKSGIPVPKEAILFDLPVMCAVAVACLPVFFNGYRIARWEGFVFAAYYGAYTALLAMKASQSANLKTFETSMTFFFIPLTVLTLLLAAWRSYKEGRRQGEAAAGG